MDRDVTALKQATEFGFSWAWTLRLGETGGLAAGGPVHDSHRLGLPRAGGAGMVQLGLTSEQLKLADRWLGGLYRDSRQRVIIFPKNVEGNFET